MRSRIRRIKRTTRRCNGGALSRISRSRSKLSNRSKRNKMKGGGTISGELDTPIYTLKLDDYLKQGNQYYYAVATAYRSNAINIWDFLDPVQLNTHNDPGEHRVSTTYYQAALYVVWANGRMTLVSDSVGNVKSTRWSQIIKNKIFFRKAKESGIRDEFTASGFGESWDKIMKRLTTILKAIAIEKDMDIATIWETDRPRKYHAIQA